MRRISSLVQLLLVSFLLSYAEVSTYGQNQQPAELIGLATEFVQGMFSMPVSGGTVTFTNGGNTISIEVGNADVARQGGFWFPKLQSGPTTLAYNDRKGDSLLTISFEMNPGTNLVFLDVTSPGKKNQGAVQTRVDQYGEVWTFRDDRWLNGGKLARHEGKFILMETLGTSIQFGDNILKILKSFKGVKSDMGIFRLDPKKVICQEQEGCLVVSEKK